MKTLRDFDALEASAERLDYEALRLRFPDNRVLHVVASSNLQRRPEYRCLIDGAPFVVTRPVKKEGGGA